MPQEMDPDGMVHEWSFTIDPTNIKTYSGLSVSAKLAPRNGSPKQRNAGSADHSGEAAFAGKTSGLRLFVT